jgi:hypothetical protein
MAHLTGAALLIAFPLWYVVPRNIQGGTTTMNLSMKDRVAVVTLSPHWRTP